MRVERPSGTSAVAAGKTVRRSGSEGFTLSEGATASGPAATTGTRSIGGIDVLMALQGVEEPGERRRRAVARGRDIYAITAPIVVEATQRVVNGLARTSGVVSAGEAFDSRDFLRSLAPAHLSFEIQ